jgi:hypothetical protein
MCGFPKFYTAISDLQKAIVPVLKSIGIQSGQATT